MSDHGKRGNVHKSLESPTIGGITSHDSENQSHAVPNFMDKISNKITKMENKSPRLQHKTTPNKRSIMNELSLPMSRRVEKVMHQQGMMAKMGKQMSLKVQ